MQIIVAGSGLFDKSGCIKTGNLLIYFSLSWANSRTASLLFLLPKNNPIYYSSYPGNVEYGS